VVLVHGRQTLNQITKALRALAAFGRGWERRGASTGPANQARGSPPAGSISVHERKKQRFQRSSSRDGARQTGRKAPESLRCRELRRKYGPRIAGQKPQDPTTRRTNADEPQFGDGLSRRNTPMISIFRLIIPGTTKMNLVPRLGTA
jgi:hypothetical protein